MSESIPAITLTDIEEACAYMDSLLIPEAHVIYVDEEEYSAVM